MRISNYNEVRDALHARESFVHGSCNAIRDDSGAYYVYSYGTLILQVDKDSDGDQLLYFDNRQYSQTTSRLQSMIRAAFPDATPRECAACMHDGAPRVCQSCVWYADTRTRYIARPCVYEA